MNGIDGVFEATLRVKNHRDRCGKAMMGINNPEEYIDAANKMKEAIFDALPLIEGTPVANCDQCDPSVGFMCELCYASGLLREAVNRFCKVIGEK